jgi:hypothetical protein
MISSKKRCRIKTRPSLRGTTLGCDRDSVPREQHSRRRQALGCDNGPRHQVSPELRRPGRNPGRLAVTAQPVIASLRLARNDKRADWSRLQNEKRGRFPRRSSCLHTRPSQRGAKQQRGIAPALSLCGITTLPVAACQPRCNRHARRVTFGYPTFRTAHSP